MKKNVRSPLNPKALISLIMLLIIFLSPMLPLSTTEYVFGGQVFVMDKADILSEKVETEFSLKASELKEKYGVDVCIITANEITGTKTSDIISELFTSPGYGTSALLFVLSPEENFFTVLTLGKTEEKITEWGNNVIKNHIGPLVDKELFDESVEEFRKLSETFLEEGEKGTPFDEHHPYIRYTNVTDNADLFTDAEEQALLRHIDTIREKYLFDIALVTTPELYGKTPVEFADDFFDYNGFGYGPDFDGLLFMISMKERDYYMSTHGFGITAFTDWGIERIGKEIQPLLSEGDYYKAFDRYLDICETYLQAAREGKPFDIDDQYKSASQRLIEELIIFVISLILALISIFLLKRTMRNTGKARSAATYISGDLKLHHSKDMFSKKTVNKRSLKVKQSRDSGSSETSSSGGSTTHVSSSGRTHGGGGGKF